MVTQDARSRGNFGVGGSGTVRQERGWRSDNAREVEARRGDGRNAGIPKPAGRAPGVRAAPARPRWAPGARWRPRQAARPLPRRGPALLTSDREPRRFRVSRSLADQGPLRLPLG